MDASFDYEDDVVCVTGGSGALGSAIVEAFADAGADVAVLDVAGPDSEETELAPDGPFSFYETDLTDPDDAAAAIDAVVDDLGGLDALCNVAGTWRGGDPVHETDVDTFEMLFDVNLKTMFLASKHAIPHLRESAAERRDPAAQPADAASDDGAGQSAIVSVSARSSLEGGKGDGPYRAAKAGVRLLTETIAEENLGRVRANAVMPSVIDTPMNREMMSGADNEEWVDPAAIADVFLHLCSDAARVTSGAAVPVYGEA